MVIAALVPGEYSRGSTQKMLMTALSALATDSRARRRAGAIWAGSAHHLRHSRPGIWATADEGHIDSRLPTLRGSRRLGQLPVADLVHGRVGAASREVRQHRTGGVSISKAGHDEGARSRSSQTSLAGCTPAGRQRISRLANQGFPADPGPSRAGRARTHRLRHEVVHHVAAVADL